MSPSYSIRYRIQRTTKEVASVSVPITEDLLTADGRIDVEKASQLAVKIGTEASTRWEIDGQPLISLHPVQGQAH